MKYLGSKRRIAKYIIPIMVQEANKAGITKWVEPFVGGANLIDKVPNTFQRVGYDYNEHVIYALKDVRDRATELPDIVSEEDYAYAMTRPAESIQSWIRFVCSFAGMFDGGYVRSNNRNYAAEGKRNAIRQSHMLQDVELGQSNYRDLKIKDSLIYCDPPYQGTTGYSTGEFDHQELFEWCREMKSAGNIVFLSEYNAPEDFIEVWRGDLAVNFSRKRTGVTRVAKERLFRVY